MDRREKSDKTRARKEFFAKQEAYGEDDGSAADSWFKKRLNHVRTEARRELQTKLGRVTREK